MAQIKKTFREFNIKDDSLLNEVTKDIEITVTNWDVKNLNDIEEIKGYIEYELNVAFGFGCYTFNFEEKN